MKKSLGFLLVTLLLQAVAFGQIGAKTQQVKIFGVWQNSAYGYQMTLILNTDGQGEFDGEAISFSTQANKLSLKSNGVTTVYSFTLENNSLTLSGGDLEKPVTFTKSGTEATVTQAQPITSANTKGSIIGLWSGNGETIEFTSAGQCNYMGQVYPYQLTDGHVTLVTAQGNVMMAYAVTGNQLALTANGQTIRYTKGSEGNSSQSAQPPSGTRVAQELVGKWCYVNVSSTSTGGSSSEQCITLNANGTYEYYGETSRSVNTNAYYGGTNSQSSDRGTWSYDGTRIFYNSTQGQGSGSYLLEKRNHPKNGDPMIVLDGTTYVTYYQKAPWR
jgi:hypothetical protein